MSKALTIASLICCIAALICCTVAFSSYWYQIVDDGDAVLYKYDRQKSIDDDGDVSYYFYKPRDKKSNKSQLEIMNASLAFSILAWIVLLVCTVLLFLQLFNVVQRVPLLGQLVPMVGKFILVLGTFFILLSVFIFLGVGQAKEKDCSRRYEGECPFTYPFVQVDDDYYAGPSTSWISVVVGSAFTIAATVMNFCGAFNSLPAAA